MKGQIHNWKIIKEMKEKADLDSWVMLRIGIAKEVTDLSVVMMVENLITVARRLSMENHI